MSEQSAIKAWLHAFRLRTLPLAISGILTATAIAFYQGEFKWPVFVLALLTAVLLQILSNLANDYGDFSKGTDNDQRIGTPRALQSGMIQPAAMKIALVIFSLPALFCGLALLWVAFGKDHIWNALIFLALGLGAIAAAIKYTVGKSAYGYSGWGDIFVFIFFGLVAVEGTVFLYTGDIDSTAWLMAIAIGCYSTAVLNINNIRDIENDAKAGKITIPVRLGREKAGIYHIIIILVGSLSALAYGFMTFTNYGNFLYILAFVPLMKNTVSVVRWPIGPEFNGFLKQMAITTLIFSLLFLIGVMIWP